MSPSPYTEDKLVQQTTADYLEQQLGWQVNLCPQHRDIRTRRITLGRANDGEVVLTRYLCTGARRPQS